MLRLEYSNHSKDLVIPSYNKTLPSIDEIERKEERLKRQRSITLTITIPKFISEMKGRFAK